MFTLQTYIYACDIKKATSGIFPKQHSLWICLIVCERGCHLSGTL